MNDAQERRCAASWPGPSIMGIAENKDEGAPAGNKVPSSQESATDVSEKEKADGPFDI